MATKRVIQAPTINNSGQITGSSGKTFVTTNKFTPGIATSSSGGPTDNGGSYVDYNPTTDLSGNIISGSVGRVNYDSSGRVVTPTRVNIPKTVSSTDKSASLIASRGGVTNGLISGKSDSLPGVTKYAGQDQTAGGIKYGNNQAGIDFLNSQNKAPMQGVYNPTPPPTVATQRNPVIKKTLPKEEAPVRPDIQSMDLPTIQENIDRLTYKVNSGKNLTEDEYVTFNQLRRQSIEMMKPQSLKGGLDDLKNIQQNEIITTQQTLDQQNKADLEAFTKSQEAFKQSQFAELERADEEKKKTLGYILGAQGAGTSSFGAEAINKITDNTAQQKLAYQDSIQAKIDLYESQQRKDSAETIQKMKDRLYSTQLKAAEFDVANLQEINKYNQEQSKSTLEKLDNLKAMSDSILASSTPLTEEQKQQAAVIGQFLVDPDGGLNQALLESYKKTNPNLIPYALSMAVGERNKIQENKLAMQGLDADIKKAQLNKLLNPDVDYKVVANDDGTYTRTGSDGSVAIVDPKSGASTSAVETIKKWEGFRDKAYQDSTGTWTIGYGFTNVDGKPVQPGMTMDRGTADNLLGQEISQRQNFMNYITVPLSDSQKAALSSFEFNLGSGIRDKNAKPILDKINAGDLQGAGDLMKKYTTSKGQQLQGLVNRRNEEARLLLDKGQKTAELTNSDIAKFNDNTFNPDKLKSSVDKEKYKKYLDQKSNVMGNKDSSIQDIIAYSAGGKELDATAIQRLDKYSTVLGQLDGIQKQISTMDTGPILGKLRDINPYDTNAQVLKAQLQALIPNLARGVYGEVGVLTDADIKNYAQTIPNLTQTKDVQNAILALTLDTLAGGYKNQLQTLAASKRDVSGFAGLYESIKGQADAIRSSIGGKTPSQNTTGGGRRQG